MHREENHSHLRKQAPRRVAVLRALKLGDLLVSVPALRALRAALPEAELVLVGLPWAREFVSRYRQYLDGFREFPGYPGLPERTPDLEQIPRFLSQMQAERFDLAIQMHGSGSVVNPLVVLFGARRTAGFYTPGEYCPDPQTFFPYPGHGLELRRLLRLVELLGCPPQGEDLEFAVTDRDRESLEAALGGRVLRSGEYVCIHPGASVSARRWPADRFVAVVQAMAARGLQVVLTGIAAEAELTRSLARHAGVSCVELAGRTELGSLAALLSGARLLVCNDTGVSHLAAALGVPSVIISTGTNPDRWAPVDADRHRVLCHDSGILPQEVVHQAALLLERACNPLEPNLAFPPQRNRGESRSAPHLRNVNLEEDRSTPKLVLGPR